jgi:hypothetical protein
MRYVRCLHRLQWTYVGKCYKTSLCCFFFFFPFLSSSFLSSPMVITCSDHILFFSSYVIHLLIFHCSHNHVFFLFSSFAPSPLILPCSEMTMMSGMETVQMISHYIVLSRVLRKNNININIPLVSCTITFTVPLSSGRCDVAQ